MKQKETTIVLDMSGFPSKNDIRASKTINTHYNPVEEYTLDGIYIKTWKNPSEAAKHYNISISAIRMCCRREVSYIKSINKIFLYKGDNIGNRLNFIDNNVSKSGSREVDVYNIKGELIGCFSSFVKAANKYNIDYHWISKCCKGIILCVKDLIFLYPKDNIKIRLKLIKQKKALDDALENEILKH